MKWSVPLSNVWRGLMKRWLLTILILVLLLPGAAYAAEPESVRIAIIDTGISTAAVDPERIADGFNYIRPEDDLEDKLGHGTAVSAIIVGSGPARVAGICPTATLVPLIYATKDENGAQIRGNTGMVAQAIYDAIDIHHCDIINISSGSTAGSHRLKEAVEYAEAKGVLVVSCAGNSQETNPGAVYYPGGYESVICVGAANSDGTIAAFSQKNDTVDLLALGTDLRLASVKGTRIRGEGTSFSTAIITGAAAQLWTDHPDWTMEQVREALLSSTRSIGGWKIFDLEAALAQDDAEPEPVIPENPVGPDRSATVLRAAEWGMYFGRSMMMFGQDVNCIPGQAMTVLWKLYL